VKESEDNLENFFRNRAESNQYGFEEGDWTKMEAKLDAEMPVVSAFPYSNLKWMAAGSVITALLMLGYNQFSKSDKEIGQASFIENQSVNATQLKPLSKSTEVVSTLNGESPTIIGLEEKNKSEASASSSKSPVQIKNNNSANTVSTNTINKISEQVAQSKAYKNLVPSNNVAFIADNHEESSIGGLKALPVHNYVTIPQVEPIKAGYQYADVAFSFNPIKTFL